MDGVADARAGGRAGWAGSEVVAEWSVGRVARGCEEVSVRPFRAAFCLSDSVWSTRRGRPFSWVPFKLRRADIAVSLSSYSQNP